MDHLSYQNHLKDISFTIQSGEIVGLIGPKNSGKTTILKILSGLLKPSSGFVSVLDYDPFLKTADFLKQISFLFNTVKPLLNNLTPIEVLEITKEVYGLTMRDFNKSLNDLTKYIADPVLLDSLIYRPKIVILDEQNNYLNQIYEYNSKNQATVIIAEEKIDDLVGLVRRVIVVDEGRQIFDGPIDEIIEKFAKEKLIKIKLSEEINTKDVEEVGTVKKYVFPYLYLSAPRSVAAFAAAELLQKLPVTNLNIEELPIDEIINNMKK